MAISPHNAARNLATILVSEGYFDRMPPTSQIKRAGDRARTTPQGHYVLDVANGRGRAYQGIVDRYSGGKLGKLQRIT